MMNERQRRMWDMRQRGATVRDIAAELGISYSAAKAALARARRWAELPEGVQSALTETGIDPSHARMGYRRIKDESGSFNTVMWKMPPEGDSDFLERAKEAFQDIVPAPRINPPAEWNTDLLTVYPIADAHIGMMAWGKETGEAYDTEAACARLTEWIGRCVDLSPASDTAVILDVGDLMHADDSTNVTPASKHVLDVDTRHYRTLEATIATMAAAVDYAAQKHAKVIVRIMRGNHNPHSYMAVMLALKERYRLSDQVEIQATPQEFWVHTHGDCFFAAHHGDKTKAERLIMFLADEYAKEWGSTRHRHVWTGHLHHHKSADIGGATWEQLRAMTARDAYAVSHAYCARAQLQGITFHKTRGEIQRVKVAA